MNADEERMPHAATEPDIRHDAPISTWFGVGGGAARFAQPRNEDELLRCIEIDPRLRVLGDGANLLVDDEGVANLVVSLRDPEFAGARWHERGVTVGAGHDLPRLILEACRRGLGGLEGLGGIPASVGGALIMNAGGAFGQIAGVVERVHALDRRGQRVSLPRECIAFGYRHSGLGELILTGADLALTPGDAGSLRDRLKEVMAYKKASQPMAERSAGCCFKNPTLSRDIEGVGHAGERVSAGKLIDAAGLKGLAVRGAMVSERHANFLVTRPGARAHDVIELMREVRRRLAARFGVTLEPEVVVWRRDGVGLD